MTLPDCPRVRFRKSPLGLVLGQIRFPILTRFSDGIFVAPFHEAIKQEYPRPHREKQMGLQITPQGVQSVAGEALWRYTARDNEMAVVLGEGAVTLEAKSYQSIDDFLDRFGRVLKAAQETLGVGDRVRLGLRYVNEIRHPEASTLADWGRLLRPEFVGFAATGILGEDVEHSFHELRFRRTDGVLAVRHGLLAGAVVEVSPRALRVGERFYLLDMDYYDETECSLNLPATLGQMRAYNEVLRRFFCWTLGARMYEYLEPEPC